MLKLKKRDSEVEILMELLAEQEAVIREAFLAFVDIVKSDSVLKEVNAALANNDIERALDIVDTHIIRMATVIPATYTSIGAGAMTGIASTLGTSAVGISFDPTDTRTANIIREARLNFIRETTAAQRDSVRQALVRSFETGQGPRAVATSFRDSLGLTARQEQAVQNYRTLLERNSVQSLTRDLRDRRFDRSVIRATETGEPLSSEKIDRMVARYRERHIQYRAEVVARTEGVRATSRARDEAMRQTIDATGIDIETVVRTWVSVNDDRRRDHHRTMQGQKTGMEGTFTDGLGNILRFPGDPNAPLETTAQCRCVVTFSRKEKS